MENTYVIVLRNNLWKRGAGFWAQFYLWNILFYLYEIIAILRLLFISCFIFHFISISYFLWLYYLTKMWSSFCTITLVMQSKVNRNKKWECVLFSLKTLVISAFYKQIFINELYSISVFMKTAYQIFFLFIRFCCRIYTMFHFVCWMSDRVMLMTFI